MPLKETLGEEGYTELLVLIQPPAGSLKAWLMGALRSWTAWFGALLVAGPEILPMLMPPFKELLTVDNYNRMIQAVGIIVILLRVKTTSSIQQKGKV